MTLQCRIWVVGHGFLGARVAARCSASGAVILTLDMQAPAELCGDAARREILTTAAEMLPAPQVVYVCVSAHGGSLERYRHTYLDTVRALSSLQPQARLVFCSSTGVYPDTDGRAVTEQTPPETNADSRVGVLVQAEQCVLAGGGVVARLAALYGPGRCELLRRYLNGDPQLSGRDDRVLNYVHVSDAARALVLLGGQGCPCGSVWNVVGENMSKAEAYAMLMRETGLPVPVGTASPGVRHGVKNHLVCSQKIRDAGWHPLFDMQTFVREAIGRGARDCRGALM